MNDNDLEIRLRNHYRSIDPTVAPHGLAARIDGAMDREASRWAFLGRMPAIATGLAAVAVVALVIAFRPGGLLAPVGATPSVGTPQPTASPTPAPSASGSLAPTRTAAPSLPGGSLPPISTEPWSTLDLVPASGNPQPAPVVAWSGGYLALGSDVVGFGPGAAWVSVDGRTWAQLPDATFGTPTSAAAAPAPDGVVVLTVREDGTAKAWHSTDGVTWTSSQASAPRALEAGDIAGSSNSIVVIDQGSPPGLERSTDGTSWQPVLLPGASTAIVTALTAFGSGFVAVGNDPSGQGSPVAWWSSDGLTWNLATVPSHPGDAFTEVHAGATGLIAMSQTNDVPGVTTFWTSPDGGRSWQPSDSPLGVGQQSEGAGNPNGQFTGDGTRLLGYGIRADGQPTEYWTSTDATTWSKLTLTGDTAAANAGSVTPTLLRDGILFAGGDRAWFGGVVN